MKINTIPPSLIMWPIVGRQFVYGFPSNLSFTCRYRTSAERFGLSSMELNFETTPGVVK